MKTMLPRRAYLLEDVENVLPCCAAAVLSGSVRPPEDENAPSAAIDIPWPPPSYIPPKAVIEPKKLVGVKIACEIKLLRGSALDDHTMNSFSRCVPCRDCPIYIRHSFVCLMHSKLASPVVVEFSGGPAV